MANTDQVMPLLSYKRHLPCLVEFLPAIFKKGYLGVGDLVYRLECLLKTEIFLYRAPHLLQRRRSRIQMTLQSR